MGGGGGFIAKAGRSIKKIAKDPVRATLAVSTLGGSEVLRAGAKGLKKTLTPKIPALGAAQQLKIPDAGEQVAEGVDRAKQSAKRRRRTGGRGSTILTDLLGGGDNSRTRRRSLLGG